MLKMHDFECLVKVFKKLFFNIFVIERDKAIEKQMQKKMQYGKVFRKYN